MADSSISNSYITHAAFTYAERKTALNWRFGTLWSNKMAYRYQFSNTSKCPLCGEPDGGEHISGGCRHASMERMYTARHHHTGRILLKAISKGSMGAGLVMADLGSAANCEKDGAPVLQQTQVPAELLPTPTEPNDTQGTAPISGQKMKKKLQPDAMIVQYPGQGSEEQYPTIYIVEFKYCRDTMPGNQLQACHTQHEDLISQLTAKGTPRRNIKLIPILLGHSGTIYTEHTLQGMETLGISKQCAKKCAQKMHIDAIKQLHSGHRQNKKISRTSRCPQSRPSTRKSAVQSARPQMPEAKLTAARVHARHELYYPGADPLLRPNKPTPSTPPKVVHAALSMEQKRKFLAFTTGCDRAPVCGLGKLALPHW